MSRYIATAAIRGANRIVKEADDLLQKALKELGPEAPIQFPNTAYYLPVILGFTGLEVSKIGDLPPVIERAKALLHPEPERKIWLPYLGETLDCGVATLLAEEAIEGIRFAYGEQPERIPGLQLTGTSFTSPDMEAEGGGFANGPIDDVQLRSWGIQLVDGRMPGFAAIVGAAKSNEAAVQIVRELQQRNILVFLSGNVNGRSIIHQLMEEGVEMGYDTYIVPFGTDTISAIYALGFATRSALTFGGLKGGQAREILLYNKYRVFAFVLALGEVDDLKYATAAGAISYGFPTIADTVIPQILPTGITQYEHVISMPFDDIEGKDDLERARRLVEKCIEVRGVKVKITEVPIPVPYGSAFEGERVRRADMRIEFGGKYSRAFEYLKMSPMDEVEDGKIEVIGDGFEGVEMGGSMDLGIVVEVAGRKMQEDFEPVLERQIHYFLNAASGVQHIGQRDIAWIRISKAAAEKGFNLEHFGKILHARFHSDFGAIVDKVQVTIITEPELHAQWLEIARKAYDYRNKRIAEMTDESVDTFYSCVLCLPEGEEIVLPDGSFMPVERLIDTVVEERDLSVLTFDTTRLESRPVGEVFISPSPKKLIKITLGNGNSLTLTANHKVLVDRPDGLAWVPARKVKAGDCMVVGKCTNLESHLPDDGDCHIIDYLPRDYKVADDEFVLGDLKGWILERYGSYAEAARRLDIPYRRLYSALYGRREFSHQRFTIGELQRIIAALGRDWDEVKRNIKVFQAGCKLQRTSLDEGVMYLAGLVAADGYVLWRGEDGRSGCMVQFTNSEPTLVNRFCQIHRALFGVRPQAYTQEPQRSASKRLNFEIISRQPVTICRSHNTLLGRLMEGLGIGARDREEKWSGEVISTLPPKLVAAFLRGLFDGDGHVSGNRAFYSTGSYQEAKHIHLLLKKLGIDSYISKTTRGYQVGTRNSEALTRFRQLVSSEHPRKRARLMQIELRSDKRHVVRSDGVPLSCGRLLRELLNKYKDSFFMTKLPVDYKTIIAWTKGKCRPSKEKLGLLLAGLQTAIDTGDPLYQELLAWSHSDVSFERVKRVEKVDAVGEKVYNFSVAKTHNYLVNNYVVKNCQSFAPNHVCVISPERLGLCGAYNWLDCKASHQINPTGPNQPIKKGTCLDPVKGYFTGVNEYAKQASHGTVEQVSMYSIMENPMTACFTRDAEVIIDNKPVRIGDFVDEHIDEGFHYASALTMNGEGEAVYDRIVGMHKNPAPEKFIKVVTKSGDELLLTPNHKIAVDGPEGIIWVRADQIKAGDRVYSLKRLDLPESVPQVIDILPEDLRVDGEAMIARIKGKLRERYGSLAAAYREIGLQPLNPRVKSISLADLRRMVAALGEDWDQIKASIHEVVSTSGHRFTLPELSADLFYVLGLLASDGSIDRRGKHECLVNFINSDEGLLAAFEEAYANVFPNRKLGCRKKDDSTSMIEGREIRSTKDCFDYYGANPLLGVISEYFGVKMDGDERWDLGRMLSLPRELIAAFIAGHFDGDGSVRLRKYDGKWDVGEAYLCIDDKRAARHLQLLLKRLGIVGNLRQSNSVYKIELHGSNLRRFAELIPSRHPDKGQTLREIAALPKHGLDKTQAQVLPLAAGKALASLPASRELFSPSTLYYYETARSRPVLDNVRRAMETHSEATEILAPWADNDYFLDIVTEVEEVANESHDYVYNLTLMDIHSYFVNSGTLVKNCGCFECIMMIIPEANGFMIVSREDPSMTPAGMTFSTLAGMCGGGIQTPGVMGIGKYFIVSKKFIPADGGLKRIVWMSSFLKETMREELQAACEREGVPDLLDKIADERVATTVEELLAFLEEKGHPALTMPPLF